MTDSHLWRSLLNVFVRRRPLRIQSCKQSRNRMEGISGMEKYLREHYEDEITSLMNLPNDREHLPIHVE